jgi:hypothetical protein
MARYSENSIAQIQNIADGKDIKDQRSGWQKRAFAIALAPARHCFHALEAPNKDGLEQPVRFAVARMDPLLKYIAGKCPGFRADLEQAPSPIQVVLSWDEITAGNVLATQARMKATIFYINDHKKKNHHTCRNVLMPSHGHLSC